MSPAEYAHSTACRKCGCYMLGPVEWRCHCKEPEPYDAWRGIPANPYGDEYQNPAAQAFRSGFDVAARKDGYTYSRVDGEYRQGGEFETDEFPEGGDVRELA